MNVGGRPGSSFNPEPGIAASSGGPTAFRERLLETCSGSVGPSTRRRSAIRQKCATHKTQAAGLRSRQRQSVVVLVPWEMAVTPQDQLVPFVQVRHAIQIMSLQHLLVTRPRNSGLLAAVRDSGQDLRRSIHMCGLMFARPSMAIAP